MENSNRWWGGPLWRSGLRRCSDSVDACIAPTRGLLKAREVPAPKRLRPEHPAHPADAGGDMAHGAGSRREGVRTSDLGFSGGPCLPWVGNRGGGRRSRGSLGRGLGLFCCEVSRPRGGWGGFSLGVDAGIAAGSGRGWDLARMARVSGGGCLTSLC